MRPTKKKKTVKESEKSNTTENTSLQHCFKRSDYRKTGFTHQTKIWKNLKNMSAMEKGAQEQGYTTHASLSAPPSTKPIKLYSDLSGLPAPYKDPKTKLRYANTQEYQMIQHLSPDVILGLLSLRKG